MKKNKKIFFILILTLFLVSFLSTFCLAQRELEVEYPEVRGEKPGPETTLPGYVRYIFNFSLIIAAIAAFAVAVYGGFRYLTSAGAPAAMTDAKSWIFGGILGLVILLCSYLILITINPELISPQEISLEPVIGIYLINDATGEKEYFADSQDKISFEATSIEFISPASELYSVFVSVNEEFDVDEDDEDVVREIENPGSRTPVPLPINNLQSVFFFPYKLGVYLYAKENYGTPPVPRVYQASSDYLENFNDKTRSIKIKDSGDTQWSFGVVLHEDSDFGGKCAIAVHSFKNIEDTVGEIAKKETSSITIFNRTEAERESANNIITLYEDEKYEGSSIIFEFPQGSYGFWKEDFTTLNFSDGSKNINDEITSLKIDGNLMVVLYEHKNHKGKCSVFFPPGDKSFRDDQIGQCLYCPLGWCRLVDCASSMWVGSIAE